MVAFKLSIILLHCSDWMQFTMREARLRRVPTLFLRFEDLVANPEPELRSIMSFLLGVKDLSGTNAERRIHEVLSMGKSATRVYDLKQSTLRFNSNVHRYTQEQLAWIQETQAQMLHFFGYAKIPQDPNNPTGFFEFSGRDEELNSLYNGWRAQNADMINWSSQLTDQDLEMIKFKVSDPNR